MQYILSAAQMRATDKYVIDNCGIAGLTLMENAARAVADYISKCINIDDKVIIFCGKGNNGGDGLAVARLLAVNCRVKVVMTSLSADLSPDANTNFEMLPHNVDVVDEISDRELGKAKIVVDAMLGTGSVGALHGKILEYSRQINRIRNSNGVIAIDLPTGINADTGETTADAIIAKTTLTLACAKPGIFLYPGAKNCGKVIVCDIGFPDNVIEDKNCCGRIYETVDINQVLPRRSDDAHKSSVGWVMVIAGSRGMTGAAVMASTASCRSGAGLVRLAMPASLIPVVNATTPAIVCLPMPEHKLGGISHRAVEKLLTEMKTVRAVLIGPGMSRQPATANAIRKIVKDAPLPIIIDADAITAISGYDEMVRERKYPTVLTPHPGEMSRLLNIDVETLQKDRIAYALQAAKMYNATVVFKGTPAIIASPGGQIVMNVIGSPTLAVAGSGDMLAGIITGLVGQGMSTFDAAVAGCYIGSTAAHQIAGQMGNIGVITTDIISAIPLAIKSIVETEK
jgi:NAD(P)H-hydrate epimerase